MFSLDFSLVWMVRKNRPDFQAGKLNGIGGKVELREDPISAMVREFREETGAETRAEEWLPFARIGHLPDWAVYFYACQSDRYDLETKTDETIVSIDTATISTRADVLENMRWLIPLAMDRLKSGNPIITEAFYRA